MDRTTTSLITEINNDFELNSFEEIDKLAELKNEILKKMQKMDSLNLAFKQKNQYFFLKTFQKIMNDLSQQLKNSVEAYQNIDQQIERDPKCILLSKHAQFYKGERQTLDQKYNEELIKLHQVKMKNLQLKQKRNELRRKSLLSQQKVLKYTDRNKCLSLRLGDLMEKAQKNEPQTQKKFTESTKYHTSGDKTRISSFNSVNRKTFFENIEMEDEKSSGGKNCSLSKNKLKKIVTSEDVSSFRINNFL